MAHFSCWRKILVIDEEAWEKRELKILKRGSHLSPKVYNLILIQFQEVRGWGLIT